MRSAKTFEMKEIDRIAIEEYGIPSLELMERAALHVTEKLLSMGCEKGSRVAVVCGTGNNGGDGLAVARQLATKGVEVYVYLLGNKEKSTADSLANQKALEEAGISLLEFGKSLPECEFCVDALFGVGLNREIKEPFKSAIEAINNSEAWVVSCDIPSGINGDSGEICGLAVKADATVTFTCSKPGLECRPGCDYAGEVRVVDIGVPKEIVENVLGIQ